jgi:hypothetical protein
MRRDLFTSIAVLAVSGPTAHIVTAASAAPPNGWAIDRIDVTAEQ